MSSRLPANLPVALRTARGQLDRWRSRHRPHTRLPEELWQKAVTLAQGHGLNRTASALGLKYDSLKKRMAATVEDRLEGPEARYEFVEVLTGPRAADAGECMIELDDGSGTMVRMHLKGVRLAELASFAAAWRSGRA